MKILLFGKNGQVGWELQRSLAALAELTTFGRSEVDLTDQEAIRFCIRKNKPDIIVNAAAYTAVDKAELETAQAYMINEIAVKTLAEEAKKFNAWLVHYSTDYVFDGVKDTAYEEIDIANPLSIYGQSKFNGENAIRNTGCKHLIFRSSWIYSSHGANFPLAILRKSLDKEVIEVISDTFGTPTSAELIADVTANILYRILWDDEIRRTATGTYHLVASGKTSWYEYAKLLVTAARRRGIPLKVTPNKVFPTKSETYLAAAKRPKNSEMSNIKISSKFGLNLPTWESGVNRFVEEIINQKIL
jgi:dTDP-4-dehydrorhamnose reductase